MTQPRRPTAGTPRIRILDLAFIVILLPPLLVISAAIGIWIKLSSRGATLFRQERVGQLNNRFVIYKFRTMVESADSRLHRDHVRKLVESDRPLTKMDVLHDSRLIPGGRFLRSTGLDELPQLINVMRGEMCLVGPRPCTLEEYELFSASQRERFEVAPGLTGYWQVSGKNRTTFSEMVALDIHYVRNRSCWLDLRVMLKTPLVLMVQLLELSGRTRTGNRVPAADSGERISGQRISSLRSDD